ncbi:hypothetical protein BpHYR1_053935 [Brachionus plicatilis]|uniref:HTH psq-type domain-containing protein n=1 Tax=Brachionus plicatilis TaxID=10195 RepID=A0A3M7PQ50_BRAPC|nr:hypothetical protein BpHYR1_053935 [Brachionus plicatilis]
MNEKQVCKKRKCISLEVKIEIIKKHTEQKITTSKLAKEYNFILCLALVKQIINVPILADNGETLISFSSPFLKRQFCRFCTDFADFCRSLV